MHWFAVALLLVLALITFSNWARQVGPHKAQQVVYSIAIFFGVLTALILVIRSGSAVFALLPLLVPLAARFWAAYKQAKTISGGAYTPYSPDFQKNSSQHQNSSVATRYLRMTLDHASGNMDGAILEGRFVNRQLSGLSLAELLQLWTFCQDDPQSVAVLEAYLDRNHGSKWRDELNAKEHATKAGGGTELSLQEAYELLGLAPGATEQEIKAAHRRLMQRVHPDHGGSDYLAIQVNEAKKLLLSTL